MSKKSRKLTTVFKARVALDAVSGEQTLAELASKHGVVPTDSHTQRMPRFAVLRRKGSPGTRSDRGGRRGERPLSPRHTHRLQGTRTYPVLVDVVASFFADKHSDPAWIHADK